MNERAILAFSALVRDAATEHPCVLSRDVPMASLCTFRIGGRAAVTLAPETVGGLCFYILRARDMGIPWYIFGNGSNLLPPDSGFSGIVFLTNKLNKLSINEIYCEAECGVYLNDLVLACAAEGLSGLERLYGIPARVGGAAFMNAGAHGCEIGDRLVQVTALDTATGEAVTLPRSALSLGYRHSLFCERRELVILSAVFDGIRADAQRIRATIKEVLARRRASQPLALPSAGSAFRRPATGEAWRYIDACGLRGARIGGAEVSEKHAGFIVNRGGATAADVRALITLIQERVLTAHGVTLVPEIEML